MARKDANNYVAPTVERMASYHWGDFESLKTYTSDRFILLNDDHTVSENNPASVLKSIAKAGASLPNIGIEWELICDFCPVGHEASETDQTLCANVLKLCFDKAGFHDDFFKIESDCTVSVECVSQTFTKGWLRNNYKCFKGAYSMFSALQTTSNNLKCGMHVNLDLTNFGKDRDTQIMNVRKLGYLINKHYDFFACAFNRDRRATHWCPRMNSTKEYWKTTGIGWGGFPTAHDSCCVNMGHIGQNYVEIRLVGGQKNYACFRNTMETVLHIVDAVKKLSWNDMDDLAKVFKGCNNYVFDRLSTKCLEAGVIDRATVDAIKPSVVTKNYL